MRGAPQGPMTDTSLGAENDQAPAAPRRCPRPFVKWAGGKSQILPDIRRNLPEGLGDRYVKYAEPFVGGGAVLLDMIGRHKFEEIYIGDTNHELMAAYRAIRDDPEGLARSLAAVEAEYLALGGDGRKAYYYDRRDRFNRLKSGEAENAPLEAASLLIFLNKTCFNGLWRVNSKGLFNVPAGAYSRPRICDAKNISALSEALQGVRMEAADYGAAEGFIDDRTFVYFDPPYRPLTPTSSFTSYTQGEFGDEAQRELARCFARVAAKGAAALLSNSDPKNSEAKDDFFDDLYEGFPIVRIQALRSVSSLSSGRGPVSEILVRSY